MAVVELAPVVYSDESEEEPESRPGPYSLCVGICGILPALVWLIILVSVLWKNRTESVCNRDLWSWLAGCAVVFGVFVGGHLLKMVSHVPDLKTSPLECCISVSICLAGTFLFIWEFVGGSRHYHAESDKCPLKGWTLAALFINILVALLTAITLVVAQCALLPAAAWNTATSKGDRDDDYEG
eukprot:TRINITY_DN7103_c0_g1_i11.p1 TRINITY_DN7103_c0_g1~~TRINITY_DN7103_c0_g1_i11.p1  ORF type:complete len:183 (+),score=19.55 TRINITY_DN7103_c0_g1_i11:77-625(+)